MSTFYTCEPGIKLWEQPNYTTAPGFITFSFLDASTLKIWAIWKELTNILGSEWPVVMKWRTIGYSLEHEKVQELRLRKEIGGSLTENDLIKKNETSKIYSYIKLNNTQDIKFDPNELTQHRNTILIFKKSPPDLNLIWEQLSKADKGISSQNIFDFLTSSRETLVGRLIESDTHSAAQLITPIEHSDKIRSLIERLDTIKITTTEVPEIIQSF
ncbi:hypothetical protein [Pseudomonas sp. EL_65y_Pfl2_R96]|uniref:hypothetical protein n=1 Tax=Pseudomonas sp. EL_65y_Pfl2_R96 TaxID=3088699 RepID=UPI0030D92679